MPLPRGGLGLLVAVVVLPLAGCGGGSDETPAELLGRAKTVLDDASSVHFTLTTAERPDAAGGLVGGEGDLARPASFEGDLQVLVGGNAVDVSVVSVDGTVYAQLPFTSGYSVVDPADFGIGDPASLLDPEAGISQLLDAVENPRAGEERRVDGEVVREVTGEIPGGLVQRLLTSQDPEQPVRARYAITTEDAQLRRAELTGPFFTAEDDATYVVELSDYGADVEITAPPTG